MRRNAWLIAIIGIVLLVAVIVRLDPEEFAAPTKEVAAPTTTRTTIRPTTTDPQLATIKGTLLLNQIEEPLDRGEECTGEGGFDDIAEGAQVTVTDETGTIIASGRLGPGAENDIVVEDGLGCFFEFEVDGVPTDRAFYSIEVAHRGALTFSIAEIRQLGWQVSFDLG